MAAKVTWTELSSAGMIAEFVRSPRYPNDQFDVNVYAHTGSNNLEAWGFTVS